MKFILKLQEFKKCLWDGERVFLGHGLPGHTALLEKHLTDVRWSSPNLETEGSVGLGHPSPSVSQKEGIWLWELRKEQSSFCANPLVLWHAKQGAGFGSSASGTFEN